MPLRVDGHLDSDLRARWSILPASHQGGLVSGQLSPEPAEGPSRPTQDFLPWEERPGHQVPLWEKAQCPGFSYGRRPGPRHHPTARRCRPASENLAFKWLATSSRRHRSTGTRISAARFLDFSTANGTASLLKGGSADALDS